MNTPKILTAGILAAASLVTTASAVTNVYITGSTAFRTAASNAISTLVGATPVAVDSSATLASYQGANAQTWSTASFFVQTSWSGSAAGVQTVSNSVTTVRFLPAANVGNTSADPRNTTNPADTHTPDICFADCQQASTAFNTNVLPNYDAVGVVTFTFAGSNGFPAGQSMTNKVFSAMWGNGIGALPLSFITGAADSAGNFESTLNPAGLIPGTAANKSFVYATGRDPDSGTRITALAETGFGVANTTTQWKPTPNGSGTITSMVQYPGNVTINAFPYTTGGGESSGGSLRAYLTNSLGAGALQEGESGPSYLVTYLGISDYRAVATGAIADTGLNGTDATGRPAVALNYNGVPFSIAGTENGSYTFWGYEYIGARVASTFYTSLRNTIQGSTTASLLPNISLKDMQVQRGTDGGLISSRNF